MKRTHVCATLIVALLVIMASGCRKPPKVDVFEEIRPNETAYVVPLEGDTKNAQGKFNSADFLESMKVAAKRVRVPLTEKKIGRYSHEIEWVPSVMVIKVDRSPETREWCSDPGRGTSAKQEGIEVESADSIGFSVGVNITAMIEEKNTSLFLYTYAGKTLSQIMDTNVRGDTQSLLANAFGALSLTECKKQKGAIIKEAGDVIKAKFAEFGVTIISFGNMGGLIYTNQEIQKAIDDAYVAEMDVAKAAQEKLAQDERNKLMIAKVEAEAEAAKAFKAQEEARKSQMSIEIQKMQAEALLEMAKNWNGQLPASILPEGSSLLLGLNGMSSAAKPSQPNIE